MAKKFIPYEKRSKKEQKAWDAIKRRTWEKNCVVTKVVEDKTKYNRKKFKRNFDGDDYRDCVFYIMYKKYFSLGIIQ